MNGAAGQHHTSLVKSQVAQTLVTRGYDGILNGIRTLVFYGYAVILQYLLTD
jgi:hypothetical protein